MAIQFQRFEIAADCGSNGSFFGVTPWQHKRSWNFPASSPARIGQPNARPPRVERDAIVAEHGLEVLARRGARGTSRRKVIRAVGAGMALTTLGQVSLHAQEATPGAVDRNWAAVEDLIRNAERAGGVVGVAVYGAEGELFSYHGDRRFRAASTIKVPIMIEAYRQVEHRPGFSR